MRTLILDDEEAIVELLGQVCAAQGHIVKTFTSSADALLYLATEPVDLLITDLCMPSPDGPMVIREARRLQPELFTMMITGHAGQYRLEDIMATGTADVLFKPFHVNELRARLALAERRWRLIGQLLKQRRDLQIASNAMIDGLEAEIEGLRRQRNMDAGPQPPVRIAGQGSMVSGVPVRTTMSTRRLRARPSGESFNARGWNSP